MTLFAEETRMKHIELVALLSLGILLAGCADLLPTTNAVTSPAPTTNSAQTILPPTRQPTATASSPMSVGVETTPTLVPATRTPTPTATTIPGVEIVYPRGAVPARAETRLGIGRVRVETRSPDGSLLALGTDTGIYMFEIPTMRQIWQVATEAPIVELKWSPDSTHIVYELLHVRQRIFVRDGRTGHLVQESESGVYNYIGSFTWSPDSMRLVMGTGPILLGTEDDIDYRELPLLSVRDMMTGEEIYSLIDPDQEIGSIGNIRWSPDGRYFAANIRWGNETAILSATDGALIHLLTRRSEGDERLEQMQYFEFSPDTRWLVGYTGTYGLDAPVSSSLAFVWNVETGEHILTLNHYPTATSVQPRAYWSPDSRLLITRGVTSQYGDPEYIFVWDIETGKLLGEAPIDGPDLYFLPTTGAEPYWLADGQSFIRISADGQVVHWDTPSQTFTQMGTEFARIVDYVPRYYFQNLPGTDHLLWDAEIGTPLVDLRLELPMPEVIAWSDDESQIAAVDVSNSRKGMSAVWEIADGWPVELYPDATPVLDWFNLAPYGADVWDRYCAPLLTRPIVIGEDNDTLQQTITVMLEADDYYFRGEYRSVITVTDRNLGHELHEFVEEGLLACWVAFSPDGRLLAVGHQPQSYGVVSLQVENLNVGSITLYDLTTGELIETLYGHTGAVYYFAFSSDGTRLATGSADGTILIWNLDG